MKRHSTAAVSTLLFFSGMCALVYQTVWLRELRLVFGASTSATAAVLAIFMGGLGWGSAVLGKRADRQENPLGYYARLEMTIAAAAAASMLFLIVARFVYIAAGGSIYLGITLATVVRLLLATIVLGIPTFLMGGTLPAAARSVETASDLARRNVATLYAANTAGAVVGTVISTFYLLEVFGNLRTMLLAAGINLIAAISARAMAREAAPALAVEPEIEEASEPSDEALPPRLVFTTSALVGFAFLLMELVWYRMLGPILGGTTFTFGLILAMALLGIGLGGFAYSLWNRASVPALVLTTGLEALAMIIPFALGDRIAHYANLLRTLGEAGFQGHIVAWGIVTAVVVLPASLVAGFQFPLLVALLGRGRGDVGRHIGQAYAWNTFGAIAGSLGGGFGLIPLLLAPGAWRFVVALLAILSIVLSLVTLRGRRLAYSVAAFGIAALALLGTMATGPTAGWRHSGIGVGRMVKRQSINDFHAARNEFRSSLAWEADGRESNVAILAGDELSFVVNGKPDGSARGDAGTQVMGGLIGAMLHPNPRNAFVIGLGTGSTAGWLGAIDSMERVDVAELEPVVLHVAEQYAVVNRDVMKNPRVHTAIADAREALLTSRRRYDIIFSEPSNPYRAGIASLFTKEFYRAVAGRLEKEGIFLQWVQAYDIDSSTLRTIYATLTTVFPHVDTFWTTSGDLILVSTREPLVYDIDRLRRRIQTEPYRSALMNAWRGDSAEAFLAQLIANEGTAAHLAKRATTLNTDDATVIEFGFARGLGLKGSVASLAELAARRGEQHPLRVRGAIDWPLVQLHRASIAVMPIAANAAPEAQALRAIATRFAARTPLEAGSPLAAATPVNMASRANLGYLLAEAGDARAIQHAEALGRTHPIERDVILSKLAVQQGRFADGARLLHGALIRYRTDPWPDRNIMQHAVEDAVTLASADLGSARAMLDAVSRPYAAAQFNQQRRLSLIAIAGTIEWCGPDMLAAIRSLEPYPPWVLEHLRPRLQCYAKAGLADLAMQAEDDYRSFTANAPEPLGP